MKQDTHSDYHLIAMIIADDTTYAFPVSPRNMAAS
jgi:hypothetical protein